MKRIFFISTLLITIHLYADDYETAQRFNEGDTISADVMNDILDKIELTLKTLDTSDLVGSWDVTWKTCINGGPGNCISLDVGSGWSSSVDNLYKTRTDTWTITADGDDTYTMSISNYCISGASSGQYYNDPCTARINIDDGIFLYGTETGAGVETPDSDHTGFFSIKRISDTRVQIWDLKDGSNSFVSLKLDKQSIPPKAPKNLSVTRTADKAFLSWSAGDSTQTSYNIKRKTSSDGTFTSIGTSTAESYEDTLTKGNNYWYRVFATDSDGTGLGSNVIQIAYINNPPYLNLPSIVSINEGITTNVISVTPTDADGDSLTITLGSQSPGNDASDFTLASNGQLSFNQTPDYETPLDYDSNNIYDIKILVSDGNDTVSQDIGVVVLNVSD
jgi:hypothetical protein